MKYFLMILMLVTVGIYPQSWEIKTFVDEFGDDTGKQFLQYYTTDGRFNNSATINSKLSASVNHTDIGIYFVLYKYGSLPVSGSFKVFKCSVKAEDKIYKYNLELMGDMLIFTTKNPGVNTKDESHFIELLKNNIELKVHLKISEYYVSGVSPNYNFTIITSGYNKLYKKLGWDMQ